MRCVHSRELDIVWQYGYRVTSSNWSCSVTCLFRHRLRDTTWWQTRQTDLDAPRSSTRTRTIARRPSPHPARPRTRLFPLAPIRAAASESIAPQAQAQDPIPTARRGPRAAPTTRDPIIPLTAPLRQADSRTVPPTVTSLIACSLPTILTCTCPGIPIESTLQLE
jgi:hypothetical protein